MVPRKGRVKQRKAWIQQAIKNPGSLRQYVSRKYGRRGFTKKGAIKVSILRRIAKDTRVSNKVRSRARLALTLRRLRRAKRL